MNHYHNDTSAGWRNDSEPGCTRPHLPTLRISALPDRLGQAGSLMVNHAGKVSATSLAGLVASGHTHGQTTWAVVILACVMLTADTVQTIVTVRWRH